MPMGALRVSKVVGALESLALVCPLVDPEECEWNACMGGAGKR